MTGFRFSNGTEGYAWMDANCARCERDHATHDPDGDWSDGCEILVRALCNGETVEEWTDESATYGFTLPPAVRCSEFVACASCVSGEEAP